MSIVCSSESTTVMYHLLCILYPYLSIAFLLSQKRYVAIRKKTTLKKVLFISTGA